MRNQSSDVDIVRGDICNISDSPIQHSSIVVSPISCTIKVRRGERGNTKSVRYIEKDTKKCPDRKARSISQIEHQVSDPYSSMKRERTTGDQQCSFRFQVDF